MSKTTKTLVGLLLIGLAGIAIVAIASLSGGGPPQAKACTVGQRDCLPDVAFVDTQGTAHTPAALAGKVVVVNVWATWCAPCLKEIPDLSAVYDKYKDQGLVILGVLHDDPDNQTLLNFQSDHMMTYPVVRESADIVAAFGPGKYPTKLPTTLVYDRAGREVRQVVGAVHGKQLEAIIRPLLAQR
jgi:thiol-disulfide isomerase/thioredoxin